MYNSMLANFHKFLLSSVSAASPSLTFVAPLVFLFRLTLCSVCVSCCSVFVSHIFQPIPVLWLRFHADCFLYEFLLMVDTQFCSDIILRFMRVALIIGLRTICVKGLRFVQNHFVFMPPKNGGGALSVTPVRRCMRECVRPSVRYQNLVSAQ